MAVEAAARVGWEVSGKIAAYMRDTHFLGGVRTPTSEWLPGWPCCCSGDRVRRIMASHAPLTWVAGEVTCKGCLRTMAKGAP